VGGHFGAQDRYQEALRGVCGPVDVRAWPAALLDCKERDNASNDGTAQENARLLAHCTHVCLNANHGARHPDSDILRGFRVSP
jgi:hypothetical protein